jgi:hypothetical protein
VISGLDLLIQVVVLSLLNVPGRDILDPVEGGGIPELIGLNIDDDTSEITAEVSRRVAKSQDEILAAQTGLDLDEEEKVRTIELISVDPGNQIDEIFVKLRVVNEAGRQADIVV